MISKTSKKFKRIAFFGDRSALEKDEHFKQAVGVAQLLAKNGYIIVNGGGPGIMLAATLGAKAGGGKAEIVILNPKNEPDNYEGVEPENIKVADKVYQVDNYQDRVEKLIEIADAFVVFKGGVGTLSEVGMTWELATFNFGRHEPLIFFGKCWERIIRDLIVDLNLDLIEKRVLEVVEKPEEVLRILRRISRPKSGAGNYSRWRSEKVLS
jgi:uncharacterized protein (TIGR00725 family)